MPNSIRIAPPSNQLVRGEMIRVPITLALDEPLKVRGIHARFHGAEESKATYTTTTTDSKGHTTTHTHTAYEHVSIVQKEFLLAGKPKLSYFGNLQDAAATLLGGGKHELLQPGEYPFTVDISIPADAQPTHVGNKSRVFYELSVQVDVPLAKDLKTLQAFQVSPLENSAEPQPVRIRYPEDTGRGFFDKLFGLNVRIEMALIADRYRIGETMMGIVVVDTEKPINCRAIRARLVGEENSQAQGHRDSYQYLGPAVEVTQPGEIISSYKHEYAIAPQVTGPPTARGQHFNIEWFFQLEFDVPWAKDPSIRVPITLLPAV